MASPEEILDPEELADLEALAKAEDISTETPEGQDKLKTLKYQLLGQSLTKAGQDSVDQTKVSSQLENRLRYMLTVTGLRHYL